MRLRKNGMNHMYPEDLYELNRQKIQLFALAGNLDGHCWRKVEQALLLFCADAQVGYSSRLTQNF